MSLIRERQFTKFVPFESVLELLMVKGLRVHDPGSFDVKVMSPGAPTIEALYDVPYSPHST